MPDSRLTLSDRTDRLGMPRLRIDLRFAAELAVHGQAVRAGEIKP